MSRADSWTVIGLIADERARQRSGEGYEPEHDDAHYGGELARAAAVYACPDDDMRWAVRRLLWPETWRYAPGDNGATEARIRELVKAGALIVAEVERLLRADPDALDRMVAGR